MLETIILLTSAVEQSVLGKRLTELAPALRLCPVSTLDELLAVPDDALAEARLLGFATPVIVPGRVLERLGYGAYNFHPGPPDYPGLCPAQCAVYDGARRFGVTAHRMVERVDAGPIVGAILFDLPPDIGVLDLETRSYGELVRIFWQLAPMLASRQEPLDEMPLQWGAVKSTRRTVEGLCDVGLDIERAELDRRIAAFGHSPFGIAPTITLHGRKFRFVPEAAAPAAGGEKSAG